MEQSYSTIKYKALDGLRTIACLGIVLMHVQTNLKVQPTNFSILNNLIGFSHNFVLLFMMVSAFSLSCGYFYKFHSGSIKLALFYKKRYLRILPFFGILTLIDVVKTLFSEHFMFSSTMSAELWEACTNLTLMFGFIPGNNIDVVGVGWFLGVIFLFYICYPFFVFLISSKTLAWWGLAISVYLYAATNQYFGPVRGCHIGNGAFLDSTPYFMVGGILFLYKEKIVSISSKSSIFNLSKSTITVAYTLWFYTYPAYRFPLSSLLLYTLWVYYAISESASRRNISLLNNKFMTYLSNISLEIYLSHMMMFRIIEKLELENYIRNQYIYYWTFCLMVLVCSIFFSLLWKKEIEPVLLKNIKIR